MASKKQYTVKEHSDRYEVDDGGGPFHIAKRAIPEHLHVHIRKMAEGGKVGVQAHGRKNASSATETGTASSDYDPYEEAVPYNGPSQDDLDQAKKPKKLAGGGKAAAEEPAFDEYAMLRDQADAAEGGGQTFSGANLAKNIAGTILPFSGGNQRPVVVPSGQGAPAEAPLVPPSPQSVQPAQASLGQQGSEERPLPAPQPGKARTKPASESDAIKEARTVEGEREAAIQQQAEVEQHIAKATAVVEQQKQVALTSYHQAEDIKQADRDTEIAKATQELKEGKINPNQLWEGMNFGQKSTALIGIILGGLGAGITGGPNQALQLIQRQIDQNIEGQVKNRQGLESYVQTLEKQGYTAREARMLGEAKIKNQFAGQIEASASAFMDPKIQAQADVTKTALRADALKLNQQIRSEGEARIIQRAHLGLEQQKLEILRQKVSMKKAVPDQLGTALADQPKVSNTERFIEKIPLVGSIPESSHAIEDAKLRIKTAMAKDLGIPLRQLKPEVNHIVSDMFSPREGVRKGAKEALRKWRQSHLDNPTPSARQSAAEDVDDLG
jgi:hypothetical protein